MWTDVGQDAHLVLRTMARIGATQNRWIPGSEILVPVTKEVSEEQRVKALHRLALHHLITADRQGGDGLKKYRFAVDLMRLWILRYQDLR